MAGASFFPTSWVRAQVLSDLQAIADHGDEVSRAKPLKAPISANAFVVDPLNTAARLALALVEAIDGGTGLGESDQCWVRVEPELRCLPRPISAGLCNAYSYLARTYQAVLPEHPQGSCLLSEDPDRLKIEIEGIARSLPQSAISDIGRKDSQLPESMYREASIALQRILEADGCSFEAVDGVGAALDPIWFGCYDWNDKTSPHLVALLLLNEQYGYVEWAYASCWKQISELSGSLSGPLIRAFRHHYEKGLLTEPSPAVEEPFDQPIPSLASSSLKARI